MELIRRSCWTEVDRGGGESFTKSMEFDSDYRGSRGAEGGRCCCFLFFFCDVCGSGNATGEWLCMQVFDDLCDTSGHQAMIGE